MAHLPIDLVSDLFLRLPASSLVRCRILSKPCISLIDSPDFVASHLKRTLETGDHLMILLRSHDGVLHTVYLDALDKVTDVDHPLKSGGFTKVFGSCNGLIGLRNTPVDLAVFNPSTRKIHRLPAERVDIPDMLTTCNYVMYGFGYDSVSQDYKVLRMVQCRRTKAPMSYETKVFSLKKNEWKRVSMDRKMELIFFCFHYNVFCRIQNGVLASNYLHWILPPSPGVIEGNTFVRFDLDSEEFGILNPPKGFHCEGTQGDKDIGVLDGCLCVTDYTEFTHVVDVWVLKDYKVEGDWTKLFRVMKPESVESVDFMRPLVYSKDRSKVLLEFNVGKLVWFDLVSKSTETLEIMGCEALCSAEIVVSSLVLGCNGDPSRGREKKMVHTSNKRGDGFLSKGFKLKL